MLPLSQVSQDRQHHPHSPLHDDSVLLCQSPLSDHIPSQPGGRPGREYGQDDEAKEPSDSLQRLQRVRTDTCGLQSLETVSQDSPETESPSSDRGEA